MLEFLVENLGRFVSRSMKIASDGVKILHGWANRNMMGLMKYQFDGINNRSNPQQCSFTFDDSE